MIVLFAWLLACKPAAPEDTGPALLPTEGDWLVEWSEALTGDCVLADMSSRRSEERWELRLESIGFTIYDDTGYPVGCVFEPGGFACDLGVYYVEYAQSGVPSVEVIAAEIDGQLLSATEIQGGYATSASCDGPDCAAAGEQYGPDFAYPCTSIATYTASWQGE